MKDRSRHIIKTQSIELSFENFEDSIGIQNRIAEAFYERVQPAMNALFDELAGENYLIEIQTLEIDSGTLSNKNWEDQWVENTVRKLKEELSTRSRKRIRDGSGYAGEIVNYFFFFLEHGHLPWNCRIGALNEIENHIDFNKSFLQKLKELIDAVENVAERLTTSFSETFRNKLVTAIINDSPAGGEIHSLLKDKINYNDPAFQIATLKVVATDQENRSPRSIVEKICSLQHPGNRNERRDSPKTQTRQSKGKKEAETIFINNAGLIILHPFLPQLFEANRLIIEDQWAHGTSQNTAVNLLEYLVTGTTEGAEFDLPLNKILCGLDTGEVIKTADEITEFARRECEDLLADVIRHWPVLKNTGTAALRETFLQRNGKLSQVHNGWLLQVEQKSVDILLSSLGWGIGIIKLPWMNKILYTEWV